MTTIRHRPESWAKENPSSGLMRNPEGGVWFKQSNKQWEPARDGGLSANEYVEAAGPIVHAYRDSLVL